MTDDDYDDMVYFIEKLDRYYKQSRALCVSCFDIHAGLYIFSILFVILHLKDYR